MIVEMNYVYDPNLPQYEDVFFVSTEDASAIAAAFMRGEQVVIKFNDNESNGSTSWEWGITTPIYSAMCQYAPERVNPYTQEPIPESFAIIGHDKSYTADSHTHDSNLQTAVVDENGKLKISIYYD